jgi:hypothetical protein
VVVGLYQWPGLRRLPATPGAFPVADDAVGVAELSVVGGR